MHIHTDSQNLVCDKTVFRDSEVKKGTSPLGYVKFFTALKCRIYNGHKLMTLN